MILDGNVILLQNPLHHVVNGDAFAADEAEDPAAVPIYWVSKWVDYSDKYGLGYQLCDNSVGVLFNDSTRVLLTSNGEYVLCSLAVSAIDS